MEIHHVDHSQFADLHGDCAEDPGWMGLSQREDRYAGVNPLVLHSTDAGSVGAAVAVYSFAGVGDYMPLAGID